MEAQKMATIRNDVNLRRGTLRLERRERGGEGEGEETLVSFSLDATVSGSICIFYLAKEGEACSFTPQKPELYTPVRIPFEKGLGQNFLQPLGTGVDLKKFSPTKLAKEGPGGIFPLVIRIETIPKDPPEDAPDSNMEPLGSKLPSWIRSQTTYAILEKKTDGEYVPKVIKQKIWVNGMRYDLQEIYGIEQGGGPNGTENGTETGKECVICMSEPRDTTVFPCRHMCMCSECAKVLRSQTNRCPICRQTITNLLEIRLYGQNGKANTDSESMVLDSGDGEGSREPEGAASGRVNNEELHGKEK